MAEPMSTERGGWLPIETAPKDGTRVDLWADGGRQTNAFWERGEWLKHIRFVFNRNRPSGDMSGAWRSRVVADPSHWMPLPSPPPSGKE